MKKQEPAGKSFSSFTLYIKHKLGLLSSPRIMPFLGFGNETDSYVSGLVIEENGISKPVEGQTRWQNIKAMLKRYVSNELEGITVRVNYMGASQLAVTDKYGIFRCYFHHPSGLFSGNSWQKVQISLSGYPYRHDSNEFAEGEVMLISEMPQFGIISDIDDTIMVSYATQKLMKLRLMLLNNALTRMPFEGVAAFYHALQLGTPGKGFNPVFYLSNSEWNLYDLLYEFIEFNRIPKGPLLLRELAIRVLRPWKMKEVNKNHKSESLKKLFSMYREMKFILIGDSGQKDPEVYYRIVKEFPGRVLAIYIRDVGIKEKVADIKIISQMLHKEFNIELLLVKDTEAAAAHALGKGFITEENLQSILKEKQKDLGKKDESEDKLV